MSDRRSEQTYLYYDAFLVRIWRDNGPAAWRATVTPVGSSKGETFATIDQFIAFMQKKADYAAQAADTKETK